MVSVILLQIIIYRDRDAMGVYRPNEQARP